MISVLEASNVNLLVWQNVLLLPPCIIYKIYKKERVASIIDSATKKLPDMAPLHALVKPQASWHSCEQSPNSFLSEEKFGPQSALSEWGFWHRALISASRSMDEAFEVQWTCSPPILQLPLHSTNDSAMRIFFEEMRRTSTFRMS